MKVKILKKTIKEGDNYCIKSLYVSFTEKEIFDAIVENLKEQKAEDEKISSFCKPNEYNGNTSYAFGLNCSNYTFERVKRFGILDCKIIFSVNEKGYVNAKIQVVDKKEQINGYEEPEDDVTGWNVPAPEAKVPEPMGDGSMAEPNPITDFSALQNSGQAGEDLPF